MKIPYFLRAVFLPCERLYFGFGVLALRSTVLGRVIKTHEKVTDSRVLMTKKTKQVLLFISSADGERPRPH